jgi:hypothetical protein
MPVFFRSWVRARYRLQIAQFIPQGATRSASVSMIYVQPRRMIKTIRGEFCSVLNAQFLTSLLRGITPSSLYSIREFVFSTQSVAMMKL